MSNSEHLYLSNDMISLGTLYELLKSNDFSPDIENENLFVDIELDERTIATLNIFIVGPEDNPSGLSVRIYYKTDFLFSFPLNEISEFCSRATEELVFGKYHSSIKTFADIDNLYLHQRSVFLIKYGFDVRNLNFHIDSVIDEFKQFLKNFYSTFSEAESETALSND